MFRSADKRTVIMESSLCQSFILTEFSSYIKSPHKVFSPWPVRVFSLQVIKLSDNKIKLTHYSKDEGPATAQRFQNV